MPLFAHRKPYVEFSEKWQNVMNKHTLMHHVDWYPSGESLAARIARWQTRAA